jgi:anti-sigma factor RsiW
MLSEHQMELLTAFVDGELPPAERQAALRLVESSSEARAVLQDLAEAAQQVRDLPRRTLGNDFAKQVLQTIAQHGLNPAAERGGPACQRPLSSGGRRFSWVTYAAAACVLLAVAVGVFVATRPRGEDPLLAELKNLDPTKNQPRSFPVPLSLSFADLTHEQQQAALVQRLAKEPAVRLDVSVRDQAQAVRRLADALEGKGVKVLIDPRLLASLKEPSKSNAECFVYTEGVDANDLAGILRQLASTPKPPANAFGPDGKPTQSPATAIFESFVVKPLSKEDRQGIASLLGIDVSRLAPGPAIGLDSKAFSEGAQSPANAGGREGRYALIWASDTRVLPAAQTKAFLAGQRGEGRGTIQVLLVIRQG